MSHAPLITDTTTLAPWLDRWAQKPWLAVDTEFVRVDTYYPKLCLIQIGDGEHEVCIDTLALADLQPLWTLLARSDILKIFHSGSQDLEIFVQHTGACPAPLFDTQTAATLLNIGDQIGYAALVEKLCGVTLDKSLTRTDWSRRPLSAAELDYAALDVKHLAEIYPMLRERLDAAGRLAWQEEEGVRQTDAEAYRIAPTDAWRRLKGLSRLSSAKAQTLAAALCAWREQTAQQRNRPRKWIIEDDAIYRMAERAPQDHAQLEALAVLAPKTLERHGEALLQVLRAAEQQPAQILAMDLSEVPEHKAQLKRLQQQLRDIAEAAKLPAGFIAPRADLEALVQHGAQATVPVLQGWRKILAGDALLRA